MNLTTSCINQTALDYDISADDIKRIAKLSDSSVIFYDKLDELINER